MLFENMVSLEGLYDGLGGMSVLALVIYVGYEVYLRFVRKVVEKKVCDVLYNCSFFPS